MAKAGQATTGSGTASRSRAFEPGQKRQGRGGLRRQGLPGDDPPPQLQQRPEDTRLAQRARPRLGRGERRSPRVFPGTRMPGQMGRRRATQRGPRWSRSTPSGTCCWSGLRPRPRNATVEVRTEGSASDRRRLQRRLVLGEPRPRQPSQGGLPGAVSRVPGPRGRSRGPRGPRARHRLDSDPRRGLHDDREGLATEGNGQGAHRRDTSHRKGGGVAFVPKPCHYTVKVNRKARRRAFRAALSRARRARLRSLCWMQPRSPSPLTGQVGESSWGRLGRASPTAVVLGPEEAAAAKSFRNIERVTVTPASRPGSRT